MSKVLSLIFSNTHTSTHMHTRWVGGGWRIIFSKIFTEFKKLKILALWYTLVITALRTQVDPSTACTVNSKTFPK